MWNKKVMASLLAAVLVAGTAIGGTVAWLVAKTDAVVNTFTYGDINITLEETPTDPDDDTPNTNEYKMLPGSPITKDPKVSVLAGNEACWLFVKLEKSGGATVDGQAYTFDDYLTYDVAEGWTQLMNGDEIVEGVYYREVGADTDNTGVSYDVLKDNTVTVKDSVTKEMLNALNSGETATYPTLTVTAYAVQKDNVADALTAADYAGLLGTETTEEAAEA